MKRIDEMQSLASLILQLSQYDYNPDSVQLSLTKPERDLLMTALAARLGELGRSAVIA